MMGYLSRYLLGFALGFEREEVGYDGYIFYSPRGGGREMRDDVI
jgi:hypothetical protein